MSKVTSLADTIAAISTPIGLGGIGIVRMSGPEALAITDEIFTPAQPKARPAEFGSHTVHYGHVVRRDDHGAQLIDEVLLTVMRAPRSYTCEDVVEISCHGGAAVVQAVLSLVLEKGARLAGPGEFTKRAFLHGRIDLAQAEAVLDVIRAQTSAALRVSEDQLRGNLTRQLASTRDRLMEGYVLAEGALNFPGEADEDGLTGRIGDVCRDAIRDMNALLEHADQGRVLREGVRLVICGKPNVGKSSLLNALLCHERAIVSPIEGTTRDAVEEILQIEGIVFHAVDTAGILQPRDVIEEAAVQRSREHIRHADLTVLVLDASRPISGDDAALMDEVRGQRAVVVVNKVDLPCALDRSAVHERIPGVPVVSTDLLHGQGLDDLRRCLVERVLQGQTLESHKVQVTNIRHIEALRQALAAVSQARSDMGRGLSLEFIAEHIRQAIDHLDAITGRHADDDLIEAIFSQFCIGK